MARILRRIGVGVVTVLALLLVYGVAIEPRLILDERHYRVEVPGLPRQWAGTEVAVFSDLQIGMWLDNPAMVDRIVGRVIEQSPAAALVAGDFLYSSGPDSAEEVEAVLRLLRPLIDAGIPTYAVLGNHDYAVGADDLLTGELEELGIEVLQNEAAPIPPPEGVSADDDVYVVGLAPRWPGLDDPDAALAEVPAGAPRIVMMHNPASFPAFPPDSAPFAVAGHTHCGQISLPLTPDWSHLDLRSDERVVADGFAPADYGEAGNRLFVTCGIGFSYIPVRIGAPPQLVFFELQAAQ